MKTHIIRNACGASLVLLSVLIWASAAERAVNEPPPAAAPKASPSPEAVIKRWPPRPRRAAALLLEKYGRPGQYDRDSLAWFNTGEWKRTIVHRKLSRGGKGKTADFLEQTLGYMVPHDKLDDLKRFNPRLEASTVAGELTFASDSEDKNRLAMNLADEIATGKRSPTAARAAYVKASRLSASGKSTPLLEALQFEADNTRVMIPTGADR